MINKMKRFKLKMLVAVTVGAFTTFTMLLYVTSESARCDPASNIFCYDVYKEGLRAKNLTFQSHRDVVKGIGTGNDIFTHYRLISRSELLNVKFGRKTTANSGPLRAPTGERNFTAAETQRTRRNIFYGAKIKILSSSIVRKETTKPFPLVSSARMYASSSNQTFKKGSDESDGEDQYFYLTPNFVSLVDRKLKVPWRNESFSYYLSRQRNLHLGCQKYANQILKVKRVKLDHILIDERRKVLFCYVPKVACTNWKRIFMLLTGKATNISQVVRIPAYKVHTRNLFTSLQNYSLQEVNHILKDYTKFIFVRNPFERLLSAYHNKLEQHYESSKYFQARFGKYIVKKFRKNPSNVSLERGDDVTFSEFVDYLISSDPASYNEHWQTVTNLCHPCFINYDLIGKYETLIPDSNFVLDYLKMNFSFPVLEKPSRTASSLKKYYDAISKDVIYKLYRIYEMDFKLFGYDLARTLDWSNAS